MSDIYLSLTETPSVVTLSQPVIGSSVAATVTVGNTVTVALDANSLSALENVTVTVGAAVSVSNFPASQVVTGSVAVTTMPAISISSVTISNLPVTQTVAGTVTANVPQNDIVNALDSFGGAYNNAFPVVIDQSGGDNIPIAGTVTVGNSVTIGSLPSINGTVTVSSLPAISGTVTANVTNSVTVGAIVGPIGGSVFRGNSGSLDAIRVLPFFSQNGAANYNEISTSNALPVSGSVTVGAMPSGALTTRFGSVATANLATLTSCVTNTSRKFLLVQNIATSTVTIGIGFAPTTTQGIQLTAGAGLTFDAFCPTGGVWWLSSTTGSNFSILEG
jgi:hypothetical protein